jgi:hypothetical protein
MRMLKRTHQIDDFLIWLKIVQGGVSYKLAAEYGVSPYVISGIYKQYEKQRREVKTKDINTRCMVDRVKGFEGDKYDTWLGDK